MTMPSSERQSRRYEEHLTDAELNDFIDGTLAASEMERARTHLATCIDCEERYRTLQATVHALHSAPSLMPRRSFQLSPEQAKTPPKRPTLLDRFSEWIVPGVPAIRAATLAVALLLLSVTAIDVITHRGSNEESAGPVLVQEAPTQDEAPPLQANNAVPTSIHALEEADTDTSTEQAPAKREAPTESGSAAQESASDSAVESAGGSAAESSAAQAPQAPAPASVSEPTEAPLLGAAPSMAEVTASPIVAPAPTASRIPQAATPAPTPTPSSASNGGVSISRWRIAELALLMLLLWLAVSWFGRAHMRDDEAESNTSDS